MEHLSKDELRNVLTVAKAASHRDYVLILVAYCHALRASEAVNLRAEQVRDGFIDVPRLKGSMRTIQPLVKSNDPLLDERTVLTAYMAGKTGRLFDIGRAQFFNIFRKHCVTAGIPAHLRHPHILKHSTAMHNIRQAGIENVRVYCGHKSIASTGAYLAVDDSAASAAMAF
jgi:type 1 fimbriae regulatory protein FimB